jgi:putative ABC transport system permease protein
MERIRVLPGVRAVGASTGFPNESAGTTGSFEIESRPNAPGEELRAGKLPATPGYFRAAGINLRKGRLIGDSDTAAAPNVAVINETLARRYFPDRNPLGRRINWGGGEPWREIVGVVADAKGFDIEGEPLPAIYVPYRQYSWQNPVYVLVRTDLPPAALAGPVRKVIRSWRKDILILRLATMENLLADSVAVPRFYMLLVASFAALALAVAAVGVYGTINYSVAQRTHEIGVRMALGAERGDVLAMIVGRGLVLTLAGGVIGLAGAWASTRVLASLLFGVHPGDAIAFAGASAVLIAVALLACYIPARRATRIHPMEALRYE